MRQEQHPLEQSTEIANEIEIEQIDDPSRMGA
jgi:hypothetical protein